MASNPDVLALEALLPLSDDPVLVDQLSVDDAEAFLANPRLRSDIYWPVEPEREEVLRWIGRATGATNPPLPLAIRVNGVLVGGVEARVLTSKIGTFDYWIFPAYRGRGYATSAVRLAQEALRSACDLATIQLRIRDSNEPSLAIASRLGLTEIERDGDEIVFHC